MEVEVGVSETFRSILKIPSTINITYPFKHMKTWFLQKYFPHEHHCWESGTDHHRIMIVVAALLKWKVVPIIFEHILSYLKMIHNKVRIDITTTDGAIDIHVYVDRESSSHTMAMNYDVDLPSYGFQKTGSSHYKMIIESTQPLPSA